MKNITRQIKFEVLSPLHIGCGQEWRKGLDFLVKGKDVYVVDFDKLYKECQETTPTDLINKLSALMSSGGDIHDFFKNHLKKGYQDVTRNTFHLQTSVIPNRIKNLYRNPLTNMPVIPGSSIKGAISSIILRLVLLSEEKNKIDRSKLKELYQKEWKKPQGRPESFNWMSCIQVSDFTLSSEIVTGLYNTNIFDLSKIDKDWTGGWKVAPTSIKRARDPKGFNTFYECISPGKVAKGRIALRGEKLNLMVTKGAITRDVLSYYFFLESVENLFYVINLHSIRYIEKEIDFFTKYKADGTEQIVRNLSQILEQIPTETKPLSCIFKMSAGSGFHSITGDWKYDNHIEPYNAHLHPVKKIPIPYKTKKIIEYNNSLHEMGFVKLTLT